MFASLRMGGQQNGSVRRYRGALQKIRALTNRRRAKPLACRPVFGERLEPRIVFSGSNPYQTIDSSLTPAELAESLVGPGVEVSNALFTGGAASTGSFSFTDPSVIGFSSGIVMSSGAAANVVGPNVGDATSTNFGRAGDNDLKKLSGFETFDAAVLEFDFVPTANQVVFYYAFASEEYPETSE